MVHPTKCAAFGVGAKSGAGSSSAEGARMNSFMRPSFLFAGPTPGDSFVDQRLPGLGRHVVELVAGFGQCLVEGAASIGQSVCSSRRLSAVSWDSWVRGRFPRIDQGEVAALKSADVARFHIGALSARNGRQKSRHKAPRISHRTGGCARRRRWRILPLPRLRGGGGLPT